MKNIVKFFIIIILHISILNYSCSLPLFSEFKVEQCSIQDNDVIGTEFQTIILKFSLEVDNKDIENNITIEKDNGSKIEINIDVSKKTIIITPEEKWEPYQRYWLKISTGLQSIEGKKFNKNYYRVFQSTSDILPVSCNLLSPDIKNGVVNEKVNQLYFAFNDDVDKLSVQSAFSISPSLKGYFEWINSKEFNFHFLEEPVPGNFYTITISANAKDAKGLPLKEFSKIFDYRIDEEFPYISEVKIGLTNIIVNEENFRYENGIYYLDFTCEKDDNITFKFNKNLDISTIKESISISPDCNWEDYYDELLNNIVISFPDKLQIGQVYTLNITTGIKDIDGLSIKNSIIIRLFVAGNFSQFLQLNPDSLQQMIIEVTQSSLPLSNTVFENTDEGLKIIVDINNTDPVKFKVKLVFTNPGYLNPHIVASSLMQSIFIKKIFPGTATSIPILSYDFVSIDQCETTFEINPDYNGSIFYFKVNGGSSAIIDSYGNYLKDSIILYFMLEFI